MNVTFGAEKWGGAVISTKKCGHGFGIGNE